MRHCGATRHDHTWRTIHEAPGPSHHDNGGLARPHRHSEAHPTICQSRARENPADTAVKPKRMANNFMLCTLLCPRQTARQAKIASHDKAKGYIDDDRRQTTTAPKTQGMGGLLPQEVWRSPATPGWVQPDPRVTHRPKP